MIPSSVVSRQIYANGPPKATLPLDDADTF
jgi:hypothetical protein